MYESSAAGNKPILCKSSTVDDYLANSLTKTDSSVQKVTSRIEDPMSHWGFLSYQQKCRTEENSAGNKQVGFQAALSGHPWLDRSLINLRNLLGHPWANGHPWPKKFLMFIGVINLARMVSGEFMQETQREYKCQKAKEKPIFYMVSSPSVQSWSSEVSYMCATVCDLCSSYTFSYTWCKTSPWDQRFHVVQKSNRSSTICLSGWQNFIWI